MRRFSTALVVIAAFCATSPSPAAEPESAELCRYQVSCAPILWKQETLELTPKAGGKPYVIQLSYPAEGASATGYPAVYLLDAGNTFGIAADIARSQYLFFTPVVVVGVRYPDPFEVARRGADLTPPGATPFLAFLTQELRTEVAKRVKTDPARQALFGHSLSGWFALHVALTQPSAFDTYLVGDPSIQIGGYGIMKDLPKASERSFPTPARRVLITRGTATTNPEEDRLVRRLNIPLPKPAEPGAYKVTLAEFVPMLESIKGLQTTFVLFPDETHQSMVPAHIARGMRWALLGWDPP